MRLVKEVVSSWGARSINGCVAFRILKEYFSFIKDLCTCTAVTFPYVGPNFHSTQKGRDTSAISNVSND